MWRDNGADEIIPGLYIGAADVAENFVLLKEFKIKHILNVAGALFPICSLTPCAGNYANRKCLAKFFLLNMDPCRKFYFVLVEVVTELSQIQATRFRHKHLEIEDEETCKFGSLLLDGCNFIGRWHTK